MSKERPRLLSRGDNVIARNYIVVNVMLELGAKCPVNAEEERSLVWEAPVSAS